VCYTCGCKQPFADHGDPRNITEKDLLESTKTKAAGGADISKVKQNVEELIRLEQQAGEQVNPKQQY
jgi:hypothetical protein